MAFILTENNDWEITESKNNNMEPVINDNHYLFEEITVPKLMAVNEISLMG